MHLQENTLFDLVFWVNVTRNVAQYPLHYVTYAPAKFELLLPKVLEEIQLQETHRQTDGKTDDGPTLV